jgi:methanogenic corrinoid protein MtbC1
LKSIQSQIYAEKNIQQQLQSIQKCLSYNFDYEQEFYRLQMQKFQEKDDSFSKSKNILSIVEKKVGKIELKSNVICGTVEGVRDRSDEFYFFYKNYSKNSTEILMV